MHTDSDRALALAGVFQAAALAQQIARKGIADNEPLEASLGSLLETDPTNTQAVFGDVSGVQRGLRILLSQLDRAPSGRDLELTKYAMTLLQLGDRLMKDGKRLQDVASGIEAVKARETHYTLGHQNQLAMLADIYQRNVSTLTPRIMVSGEPLHLQNPDNQARIRAVLLAGVRAAILWRQCDGNRWKLILGRQRLVNAARQLLMQSDS